VPWSEGGWTGRVCDNPLGNTSCLVLDKIRKKTQENCLKYAGNQLSEIPQEAWPPCVSERGHFMAPFERRRTISHPYREKSDLHQNLLPTDFYEPPYSAAAVPFRWMLRRSADTYAREYNLDIDLSQEPKGGWLEKTAWLQEYHNQRAATDAFFAPILPGTSLCFLYAKQTPLTDDDKCVIVGVGEIDAIGPQIEYSHADRSGMRSLIWDRAVQHSIRADSNRGFLLPYHEILSAAESDPTLNPADFIAFVPSDDRRLEFAYASEHVSNDGAIQALLACKSTVEKMQCVIEGHWRKILIWIDNALDRLWKLRGPYPGLGSALTAFGIPQGHYLTYAMADLLNSSEDPWQAVSEFIHAPASLPEELRRHISPHIREYWDHIITYKPERFALLQLLARFDVSSEQALRYFNPEKREECGIFCTDRALLENPYLIYEYDRGSEDPISIWTIDRGMFPAENISKRYPLPAPSALNGSTDPRRVRALLVSILEDASQRGHTLLPQKEVVQTIRNLSIEPPCTINRDLLDLQSMETILEERIHLCRLCSGESAYQLDTYHSFRTLIRTFVQKRVNGKRNVVDANWRAILDTRLRNEMAADEEEGLARCEKTEALRELAESRFSVLIGPAGTGKTTLLSALCSEPSIRENGLLLLAPTGKARVKLQQTTGIDVQTIAQFLLKRGRYDVKTGRYHVSSRVKEPVGRTVIVDEASMLTEDMLGSLIDAVKGVDRFILVGDHCQLPPIGAGRPFLDIIANLQRGLPENVFPYISRGYAQLTVRRRQIGRNRDDLFFAEWFSGRPRSPGDDEVLSNLFLNRNGRHIQFVRWETEEDLREVLMQVLIQELNLSGPSDVDGFEISLGGTKFGRAVYYRLGCAEQAENWQILSPVKSIAYGVRGLNSFIQTTFKEHKIRYATKYNQVPKPMGPERIVYGDKVINVRNHRRDYVWPKERDDNGLTTRPLCFIANGEVGTVTGEFVRRGEGRRPWRLNVEFASQPGFNYSFTSSDFNDEGTSYLELAYALTVHKAQGSEFNTTFIVIPNPCRLLSRELLYTALTRQREKVVVLHQGEPHGLMAYTSSLYSEAAARYTNIFSDPNPVTINDDTHLETSLILQSNTGELMRSASEVMIANALSAAGIEYEYERPFYGNDRSMRVPTFTIEDEDSGECYLWDHAPVMFSSGQRERWGRKLAWYEKQGIESIEDGGQLLVTEGSVSDEDISEYIGQILGI